MRTNSVAVQSLLNRDYDNARKPSLLIHIRSAGNLVDRVVACAELSQQTIDDDTLTLMETWLSAYYYTNTDRLHTHRKTGNAEADFLMEDGMNPYLKSALQLDPTGCLKKILSSKKASIGWLGKNPSEQIPYDQRR